jgi:acyl dehydratase
MAEFDPAQHRMVPEQRWFEDFVLGERFVIPSRTQTAAVFAAFQTASGDTHPIHYDVEYCRARGMPDLLAHGFQTLVHTAPGAGLFPYMVEESLVGFLEQSSRFLKPALLPCAATCSTSAANWCWKECRNFSFAAGPPGPESIRMRKQRVRRGEIVNSHARSQ